MTLSLVQEIKSSLRRLKFSLENNARQLQDEVTSDMEELRELEVQRASLSELILIMRQKRKSDIQSSLLQTSKLTYARRIIPLNNKENSKPSNSASQSIPKSKQLSPLLAKTSRRDSFERSLSQRKEDAKTSVLDIFEKAKITVESRWKDDSPFKTWYNEKNAPNNEYNVQNKTIEREDIGSSTQIANIFKDRLTSNLFESTSDLFIDSNRNMLIFDENNLKSSISPIKHKEFENLTN